MNKRLDAMKPSASLQFMTRAKEMQKEDPTVIGLAGGEPDFDTPASISLAAIRSLTEGNTHYVIGPGILPLRQHIAQKLERENGIHASADSILVTPGGKNAIYLAINAVLNEGDEAILLAPAWVSYEPIILAAGGVPVTAKLDYRNGYRITESVLEAAVTEQTRLLIINYPNNPTGRILHPDEAAALEAFLLRHPEVYLLSDEIYEAIVYDGNRSISPASIPSIAERVITVNGFSKATAMTGWRVGYLAANSAVFKAAYKLYQHSLSCISGFVQAGALAACECADDIQRMCAVYAQRRDMFCGILNSTPGVTCQMPEGAFYAWVFYDIPGMTSESICQYLLEEAQVVGMPGTAYGETEVACMRFSFANKTSELEDAANRIRTALIKLQGGHV